MRREILLSKESAKFVNSLDEKTKNRIKQALLKISEDPYSLPYKKGGKRDLLRIRVGKYRILYKKMLFW